MADITIFTDDPAAAPVISSLSQGKWRKARDLAKDLCKQDKGRYLPLLITANEGLARELLGRGQACEAAQVISYLKTISPPEAVAALQQLQAIPCNGAPLSDGEQHWNSLLALAELTERSGTLPTVGWAPVDVLVTGNFIPPAAEEGTLAARMGAELTSVLQAVAATATGAWEEAQTALRTLPRHSVFQHWRLLLRGVRLAHLDERDQARQCFDTLPPDSAPARAATLWREILGLPIPASIAASSEKRAEILTTAAGGTEVWGRSIARADRKWQRSDFLGAYDELRQALGKEFATDEMGLAAVLTDALLPVPDRLRVDREWLDYTENLWIKTDTGASCTPEFILLKKFAVRTQGVQFHVKGLSEDWNTLVSLIQKFQGNNPTRDSLLWLAAGLAMQVRLVQPGSLFTPRLNPKDIKLTEAAFKNATTADPLHAEAQLALLEFYRKHGTKAQLGKQAEVLIKYLPNHKEGLREAGRLAIGRKAYAKGLEFLQRVRQLDPLDREAGQQIISAILNQALEALKKKPAAIPKLWEELEGNLPSASLTNSSLAVTCHRWTIRLAQSIIEPDAVMAEKFRLDAQTLAPSVVEALLYSQLVSDTYRIPVSPEVLREWGVIQASIDWPTVRRVFTMTERWHAEMSSHESSRAFAKYAEPLFREVMRRPVTEALEDFRELLADLWRLQDTEDYRKLLDCSNVATVLTRGLRGQLEKSSDARLQMAWLLLLQVADEYFETEDVVKTRQKLVKLNHSTWLPLTDLLLKELNGDGDDDDEDADHWGYEGDEDDDPWAEAQAGDENTEFTPAEEELMEAFRLAARNPGTSDFPALQHLIRESTLPAHTKTTLIQTLDAFIALQKLASEAPPKTPKPPKKTPKAKPAPTPDPNQGELPF